MENFDVAKCRMFSCLPLEEFDKLRYSVYILGEDWKYRYVNACGASNLEKNKTELVGNNIWELFPVLAGDPFMKQLRMKMEKGIAVSMITASPINQKRMHITGHPLDDCYLFFVSITPDKNDLLAELRNELKKRENARW